MLRPAQFNGGKKMEKNKILILILTSIGCLLPE